MAEKYPIVFSRQSGLLQEIGPDDTLIVDGAKFTNLEITSSIIVGASSDEIGATTGTGIVYVFDRGGNSFTPLNLSGK
jgi:hypothetical protein